MYVPLTTHVLPLATLHRERLLSSPGYVVAHEGDRVEASDVVARGDTGRRHIIFDLARRLGAQSSQAEHYVKKEAGAEVEKGEVLAARPTMLGLGKVTVRAPAKGTVIGVGNGRLLFAASGAAVELRASLPGVIAGVTPTLGVTIETTGALVEGVWGSGRQEYGVLRVVTQDGNGPLTPELVDVNCRGAIVVGGSADEDVFRTAEAIKVRGMILGCMSSALIPIARLMSYPVLVTDRFGAGGMVSETWALLYTHSGREALIDARPADRWNDHRPEVLIPLPSAAAAPTPAHGLPLEPGRRVRVLRPPFTGVVGSVKQILPRAQRLPSGVLALSAQVEIEGRGLEIVPLANLEILA